MAVEAGGSEHSAKPGSWDLSPVLGSHSPVDRWLVVALLGLAVWMALASFDFGVTWDEPVQQEYGELVFKYFRSGFQDTSALEFSNLHLYGGLFDLACVLAQKALPSVDKYDVRHLVNAAFGWLGIVFACRLARLMSSSRAALLTLLTLASWPTYLGHSMNNPKDIPFAAFYTAGLFYLCRLIREFPAPSWRTLAGGLAAVALAINVRAGGIVLLVYLALVLGGYLFKARVLGQDRQRAPSLLALGGALVSMSILALVLGTAAWPWAQRQPLLRPFEALARLTHFDSGSKVLFDGQMYSPGALPWDYAPRWLLLTTPLLVLVGLACSFWLLRQRDRRAMLALVYFAAAFPVFFVAWSGSALYDGVRHLLFVLPALATCAAVGLDTLLPESQGFSGARGARFWASWGLVAILAYEPLAFAIRNHPNQYTYFNPIAGGTRGAFTHYELDYWGNCHKQAVRWLAKQAAGRSRPVEFGAQGAEHLPPLELPPGSNLVYLGESWEGHFTIRLMRGAPRSLRSAMANDPQVRLIEADGAPLCLIAKASKWSSLEEGPLPGAD